MWQFIPAFLVYYVTYAMAQTTVFTLFYSILASHPRSGEWIGWVSSAGSLGRWVWPLVSTHLYDGPGAAVAWNATAGLVALLGPMMLLAAFPVLRRLATPEVPLAAKVDDLVPKQEENLSGSLLLHAAASASLVLNGPKADLGDLFGEQPQEGNQAQVV